MATRKPAASSTRAQDRHGEAGMIDVGVAGDEDDVDGVPAALVHLGAVIGSGGRRASRSTGVATIVPCPPLYRIALAANRPLHGMMPPTLGRVAGLNRLAGG